MNLSNPKSDFVNINGIRLHYLDWGGKGSTLIFLTGMGSSAYIFNKFAPRFNDKFRVLALTRRGQGDSDYPETGYDADSLTEDIRRVCPQKSGSQNTNPQFLCAKKTQSIKCLHRGTKSRI